MKTTVMSALCGIILLVACKKKETPVLAETVKQAATEIPSECGQEIILAKPKLLKEKGIELPVATKLCLAKDHSEITIELPKGYSFDVNETSVQAKPLPVTFATYHCNCSGGGACQVTFIDELGFGCMHSNCTGGCTGEFTYKGYSVNRVINLSQGKEKFFTDPIIQKKVAAQFANSTDKKSRQEIYGVSYYFELPGKASCDCEGTKACVLKTLGIAMEKSASFKIYYCDGPCNGCELTVN